MEVLLRHIHDEEMRFSIVVGLAGLGARAEPATAALKEALKDEDEHVRRVAAEALRNIRAHSRSVNGDRSARER